MDEIKNPTNADEVRAAAKAKAEQSDAKAAEPKPQYVYEVTEPCHRDGLYYDPVKWRQDGGEGPLIHVASEPQVSKALKPVDEATEKATAAKALEFAAVKRAKELGAHPELAKIIEQNAALMAANAQQQQQIAELVAALKGTVKKS